MNPNVIGLFFVGVDITIKYLYNTSIETIGVKNWKTLIG
jgi:hypothetical protein